MSETVTPLFSCLLKILLHEPFRKLLKKLVKCKAVAMITLRKRGKPKKIVQKRK